jgi:hypothetical protein
MHTKNHVIAVKRNDIQVDDKVLRADDNVGVGAGTVAEMNECVELESIKAQIVAPANVTGNCRVSAWEILVMALSEIKGSASVSSMLMSSSSICNRNTPLTGETVLARELLSAVIALTALVLGRHLGRCQALESWRVRAASITLRGQPGQQQRFARRLWRACYVCRRWVTAC